MLTTQLAMWGRSKTEKKSLSVITYYFDICILYQLQSIKVYIHIRYTS